MRTLLSLAVAMALASSAAIAGTKDELLKIYGATSGAGWGPKQQAALEHDLAALAAKKTKPEKTADPAAPPDQHDAIEQGLIIRDAYSAAIFMQNSSNLSDQGANFSYTRDFAEGTDAAVGKGAIMYGIAAETDIGLFGTDTYISRIAFLPGVELDSKLKDGDLSGSATAKAGIEFEVAGAPLLPLQYWSLNGVYTTDFDGKASIFGIEAQWLPITGTPYLNTLSHIPGTPAVLAINPTLAADYYHVADNGTFDDLDPGTDYFWVGPRVAGSLSFDTGPLERFTLQASLTYLYNLLAGGADSIFYQQYSLKYALTPDVSLETRYTHGNAPRTLEKKDALLLSLNVKWGDVSK